MQGLVRLLEPELNAELVVCDLDRNSSYSIGPWLSRCFHGLRLRLPHSRLEKDECYGEK